MTPKDLIFDWREPDRRKRDMVFSTLIVLALGALVISWIEIQLPSIEKQSKPRAAVIHFTDPKMADKWLAKAIEEGPFPGALGFSEPISAELDSHFFYEPKPTLKQSPLRELKAEKSLTQINLSNRGERVFPALSMPSQAEIPVTPELANTNHPRLVPFDQSALAWIPETLPIFPMRELKDSNSEPIRFLLEIDQRGVVTELLPLHRTEEPNSLSYENWLRNIKFKDGMQNRWFGLRIEHEISPKR